MDIVIAPNPVLRQQCEDVVLDEWPEVAQVAEQMAELMYSNNGCGLAAPQVGISKKLVVVDCGYDGTKESRNPIYLVNPRVESVSGEPVVDDEGCLSIPGITVPVARCENAVIIAQNLDGEELQIESKGFEARCMQHEIDHLRGVTLFETMNVVDRLAKLEEYKQALAEGSKPGEVG